MATSSRKLPNILIVGTPGTGKTITAQLVQAAVPAMRHVEIGALVKDKQLHDGWDAEFECYILDEDRICDHLEDSMEPGGVIVDFHGAELFPERWFDLVVVLRTDNTVLYPRLQSRGYSEKKLAENMEAEIMQVLLDEARESYKEDIVIELSSDSLEALEANVARIVQWIAAFCAQAANA